MNSLATLSAEKSRMEASFQADKKQLRSEKEEVLLKHLKARVFKTVSKYWLWTAWPFISYVMTTTCSWFRVVTETGQKTL
jgi:hypothetical protein